MSIPTIIHLATGNPHKAREFQRLAGAAGWPGRIELAPDMPAVVEDTGTVCRQRAKEGRGPPGLASRRRVGAGR